ncbi:MAG: glycosyltransferase [Phycisphaerales bacterium]|nr:glycosyltransferase [Phycisphaerales bacterium]
MRYASRFDLLSAMATQLAEGMLDAGFGLVDDECVVDRGSGASERVVRVFFNHPVSFGALKTWADGAAERGAGRGLEHDDLVQVFVDHPLAMGSGVMDELVALERFRVLLVSTDDASLLRMRWPRMRFARCLHAVWPGAVADERGVAASQLGLDGARNEIGCERRDIDVIVAGGIASERELANVWSTVPEGLRDAARDMRDLMIAEPGLGFVAACEACMPGFTRATDSWRLLQSVQRACVADVNRRRRVAAVDALRGLRGRDGRRARVVVIGPEAWREVCPVDAGEEGAVVYGGEVAYGALPEQFRRAKVCVALGPTQFTTAYSERLLLGMAAGCACVAEGRMMVRQVIGEGVGMFPEGNVGEMRARVEAMLADDQDRARRGVWGVREVLSRHLWRHRAGLIVGSE